MKTSDLDALRVAAGETPTTWEELSSSEARPILDADPWARLLLVALYRHVPRQRWVARVAQEKLGADLSGLAVDGNFGHPNHIPQQGQVPDLPETSYYFHGRGCCITTPNGELIDVDFDEHGGEAIDPWFYQSYLQSLTSPSSVEQLLVAEHLDGWWMADLPTLLTKRWLAGEHGVVITPQGTELASAIEPLILEALDTESPLRATWLWLLVGDYSAALNCCVGTTAEPWCRGLAEQQTSARTRILRRALDTGDHSALKALALVGRSIAEPIAIEQLTRRPPTGTTSTALALVEQWQLTDSIELLYALAKDCSGVHPPEPHIRMTSLRLILRHFTPNNMPFETRRKLKRALAAPAGACEGEAAFLLALLSPGDGLPRLNRALRSKIPLAREQAACALGLLGSRESLRLLETSTTTEAQAIRDVLRGISPAPGPEPEGEEIEWRGNKKRVYKIDELLNYNSPTLTAEAFKTLHSQYANILGTWGEG